MNKHRIQKIIKFLRKLEPDKFYFPTVIKEHDSTSGTVCGTVCCAIGWFPKIFPDDFIWLPDYRGSITIKNKHCNLNGVFYDIAKYLEIPMGITMFLFSDQESTSRYTDLGCLPEDATPNQVADRLERYLKYWRKYELQK